MASFPHRDTIPSKASIATVNALHVTHLPLEAFSRPCCIKSILGKNYGRFHYELTFDGRCASWEGRVRVPEGDVDRDIRQAWNRHVTRHQARGLKTLRPLAFAIDPQDSYGFPCVVGKIIEAGQHGASGLLWYKRELRVTIDAKDYDGWVFVRRSDARTQAAIEAAKLEMAQALDAARDHNGGVVRSIEEVPEEPLRKMTFDFAVLPKKGQGVKVTADEVHGYDLEAHRVAVTEMRIVGKDRVVRFRLVVPNGREYWYEGTLSDGMKKGRFAEVKPRDM